MDIIIMILNRFLHDSELDSKRYIWNKNNVKTVSIEAAVLHISCDARKPIFRVSDQI